MLERLSQRMRALISCRTSFLDISQTAHIARKDLVPKNLHFRTTHYYHSTRLTKTKHKAGEKQSSSVGSLRCFLRAGRPRESGSHQQAIRIMTGLQMRLWRSKREIKLLLPESTEGVMQREMSHSPLKQITCRTHSNAIPQTSHCQSKIRRRLPG